MLGANLRTTHRALKVLAEADVIAPTSAGTRNRIWEASAVMDLLAALVAMRVPGPLPGSPRHPVRAHSGGCSSVVQTANRNRNPPQRHAPDPKGGPGIN